MYSMLRSKFAVYVQGSHGLHAEFLGLNFWLNEKNKNKKRSNLKRLNFLKS